MIKVNDFSRPKKFEDMMELNLELTEKLVKKEKFKSGYAIISFFKSVIEFNEGTKNSHLYYEKVVDDDKKVKLKKMGKIFFEFINIVNFLDKERKNSKIKKEEREKREILLEKIKNIFDIEYDRIMPQDNLIRALYSVATNNFDYAFMEILKTCQAYFFKRDELLNAYYEYWKTFAKRINVDEI